MGKGLKILTLKVKFQLSILHVLLLIYLVLLSLFHLFLCLDVHSYTGITLILCKIKTSINTYE